MLKRKLNVQHSFSGTFSQELKRRRKRLMDLMGDDAIAILPAAPTVIRNRDIEFVYRQNSDLFYLTSIAEPETVVVLVPNRAAGEFVVFCRARDPVWERWNGSRMGLKEAQCHYGADTALPLEELDSALPRLMENKSRIYYTTGVYPDFDHRVLGWLNTVRQRLRTGVVAPEGVIALDLFLHEMRLFKSRSEISRMKQAAEIAALGHIAAMRACRPGIMEYQLEAEFVYQCMQHGARQVAYPSIIAGGANGCILHYTANRDPLQDGALVMMDAGAEYQGYASDISRTWPVNGRFSSEQRAVYEVVLEAQQQAIAAVIPGNSWSDPHQVAVRVLTKGLVKLGILQGNVSRLIKEEAYKPYFMHRTGHWLGMDVHDVGDYKLSGEWRTLTAGMTLTVEPGLYLSAETPNLAKQWHNIGIRVEDDVLVTKTGHDVLSASVPKSVDAIEQIMAMAAR